ncbi:MAG: hypothetical protein AAFW84_18470 [Cyanobacteria bacterium J06635_15]
MITVEPIGGLCNRLRSLVSVLALGRELQQDIHLIWNLDGSLNCPFDELFIVPQKIVRLNQRGRIRKRLAPLFRSFYRYDWVLNPETLRHLKAENYDFRQLKDYRKVYLQTDFGCFRANLDYSELKLHPMHQQKLGQYAELFARANVVGVHIRRGDNLDARQHSPLKEFIKQIKIEIAQDQNVCFFVATDDPDIENTLKENFPKQVFIHPKQSRLRSQRQGIYDALIDLYGLASCRKVIGSYYSSFTDVACCLRGAEKVVIYQA